VFALYDKLSGIVIAIWLIIAFPAIIQLVFELAAQGWQGWKQMFRGKRPNSHPSSRVVESVGGGPTMAKFVLLNQGETQPLQTYEGDSMVSKDEFVSIYKGQAGARGSKQIAAIKLGDGQSVKEIQ
jgi:hypothetical protein